MLLLDVDEARERGLEAQAFGVGPVDAGHEGFGCVGQRFLAHPPTDEIGRAPVAVAPARGRAHDGLRPLSDFASCMRGIATGANAFFALTVEEARMWSLPDAVLRPCLTKAAQARRPCFDRDDYDVLAAGGKKCLLLDARPEAATAAVRAYLDMGESLGVDRRYLTRHRRPWYVSERRRPADLLVTVFGRKRLRFVLNRAEVLNLTAFHCVYVKPAYRRFIGYLTCYFYSAAATRSCAMEQRVYGDGLLKFEPKDVGRLGVPDLDAVSDGDLAAADAVLETLLARGSWKIDDTLQARIDRLFRAFESGPAEHDSRTW